MAPARDTDTLGDAMNSCRSTLVGVVAVVVGLLGAWPAVAAAQAPRIGPAEAAHHVGQTATVCGRVASARYVARVRGEPTFLNLGRAYPNELFTVLIWGSDRAKFSTPPDREFAGADVCVTGRIESYRGVPEIVVHSPSALRKAKG